MKHTIMAGLLALAWTGGSALAHEDHKNHGQPPAAAAKEAPPVAPLKKPKRDPQAYFSDRELLTQNGEKVRFYSDVLKGKMVVMNVIFTNCTDACPLITKQLLEVKQHLGEQFGKDIVFVSISSDPTRDSPKEMKKFAQKNHADMPGWTWLTGKKENIEFILKRLGQFSEQVEAHSTLLVAWNFNTDKGKKFLPNMPPQAIAEQLKLVAAPDGLIPALPPKTN